MLNDTYSDLMKIARNISEFCIIGTKTFFPYARTLPLIVLMVASEHRKKIS